MNLKKNHFAIILIILFYAFKAQAVNYESNYDNLWKIEKNTKFNCEISQTINNYGKVSFVKKNGFKNKTSFNIIPYVKPTKKSNLIIHKVQPPWVHGFAQQKIGNDLAYNNFNLSINKHTEAIKLSLLEGKGVSFNYDTINLVIYPFSFSKKLEQFHICLSNLYDFEIEDIKTTILHHVKNSDELTHESFNKLTSIINFLYNYDEKINIDINSYTDSYGGRDHNLKLSSNRAIKIAKLFNNIKTEKINIVGFGEKRAVDINSSKIGRQNNRRTILKIY
jgi:outer membrane protein OmpA-like peptidoglycan-associated protein